MAWIELRRRRYVVIDRVEEVKAKGPSHDTRADAEASLELVSLAGWPAARDFAGHARAGRRRGVSRRPGGAPVDGPVAAASAWP